MIVSLDKAAEMYVDPRAIFMYNSFPFVGGIAGDSNFEANAGNA